jgi:hypothetical protein
MNFEDKVAVIQSAFQDLNKALNELCRDIWHEVDSTDLNAVSRAAGFQQRFVTSIKGFERSTVEILSLLSDRHLISDSESGLPAEWGETVPSKIKQGKSKVPRSKSIRRAVTVSPKPTLRPLEESALDDALDKISSLDPKAGASLLRHAVPAMLLAVARMIDRGELASNSIEFSVKLAEEFRDICRGLGIRAGLGAACQAFFDLRFSNFWKLKPLPGRSAEMRHTTVVENLNDLNRIVLSAKIDRNLYDCFRYPKFSKRLQKIIGDRFLN